ncbi:unnamed protein product, partial [Amoebophrya sp. A120]|eukprot:GSA120T00009592001.1
MLVLRMPRLRRLLFRVSLLVGYGQTVMVTRTKTAPQMPPTQQQEVDVPTLLHPQPQTRLVVPACLSGLPVWTSIHNTAAPSSTGPLRGTAGLAAPGGGTTPVAAVPGSR